ncbi:MAG: TIR domain-containing protein [Anaerolineaceae bacterium]|nr:TIR domain-containing protein [Anaerolineaceae bacterium]
MFFELLQVKLETNGYTWWKDDNNLIGGVDWGEAIDDAIEAATAVLLVMTPAAQESQYCTYEWSYALGVRVPVIAMMVKPVENLHPKLRKLQYLDFTNEDSFPWDKLLQALEHANSAREGTQEVAVGPMPDEQVMPRIQYGENHYRNGDYNNALETFMGALRVASDALLDDIHYRTALAYTARATHQRDATKKRDDLVRAVPHLEKAIELNENYAEARAQMGYVYRLMRDVAESDKERTECLEKAATYFKEALDQRPDMVDEVGESWWNTLGGVYKRLGKTEKAIEAYERAAREVKNNSSYPYSNLGTLYMQEGNADKLIQSYRFVERYAPMSLQKNPSDYWARGDLLVAKLALGKTPDIESIFNEYVLDAKDAPYALKTLLETLESLVKIVGKDKSEAIQTYITRLASLTKDDA